MLRGMVRVRVALMYIVRGLLWMEASYRHGQLENMQARDESNGSPVPILFPSPME